MKTKSSGQLLLVWNLTLLTRGSPIPEPDYPRSKVLDARDTKPPARFPGQSPAGAPNVLSHAI